MDFDIEKLTSSLANYGKGAQSQTSSLAEAHRKLAANQTPVKAMLTPPDPSLEEHIAEIEKQKGLPPKLLQGVAITETGGERDPLNAVSAADAQGLFQHREIFRKEYKIPNSLNPLVAAEKTAEALISLKKRFGSWEGAIAAYNWGPGNVRKHGLENAPKETQDYVTNVMAIINGETPLRTPGAAFKALMSTPITPWKHPKITKD